MGGTHINPDGLQVPYEKVFGVGLEGPVILVPSERVMSTWD